MKKIGEGHKSEVFLQDDGRILKLFVPEFAHLAAEEANIAKMLERSAVNAPRFVARTTVDARPGIIFGNLQVGMTISAAVRQQPWRLTHFAGQLAEMHTAVHDCSSSELPSQRQQLQHEIETGRDLDTQLKTRALEALDRLPDDNAVCHNDIHMLNVIVHPEESMIIDWMLATRGNPAADVASAVLQLRFGERPGGILAGTALELGRAVFWRSYLRNYLRLRPQISDELPEWEFPAAVALAGRREGRMRSQLIRRIESLGSGARSQPGGNSA
jgi:hypothetical protein